MTTRNSCRSSPRLVDSRRGSADAPSPRSDGARRRDRACPRLAAATSSAPSTTRSSASSPRISASRTAVGVASGTDALELALLSARLRGRRRGRRPPRTRRATPRRPRAERAVACASPTSTRRRSCCRPRRSSRRSTAGRRPSSSRTSTGCSPTSRVSSTSAAHAGIAVIEDCAQAAGARRGGRIGRGVRRRSPRSASIPTKNLAALGDGGAVVTERRELAERVRRLRQYGWEAKYEVTLGGGRNSRLDELQAAMLRMRLPRLDARNAAPPRDRRRYAEALAPGRGRLRRARRARTASATSRCARRGARAAPRACSRRRHRDRRALPDRRPPAARLGAIEFRDVRCRSPSTRPSTSSRCRAFRSSTTRRSSASARCSQRHDARTSLLRRRARLRQRGDDPGARRAPGRARARELDGALEVVFVVDGSPDGSLRRCCADLLPE